MNRGLLREELYNVRRESVLDRYSYCVELEFCYRAGRPIKTDEASFSFGEAFCLLGQRRMIVGHLSESVRL